MSQENVEIVRAAIDAGNRQDIETVLALMGPEPEWVNSPTALEPGVRRGRDEVAAVMRALSESLPEARWEVDRIYDRGEEVIALGRLSRRMPGSDARLEDRSLMSYKIRSRKIVQIQVLGFGRDEVQAALEAAGLSEEAMSEGNVEIARAALDAYDRGDAEALLKLAAPDCEVDWSRSVGPQRGVYGVDEALKVLPGATWMRSIHCTSTWCCGTPRPCALSAPTVSGTGAG